MIKTLFNYNNDLGDFKKYFIKQHSITPTNQYANNVSLNDQIALESHEVAVTPMQNQHLPPLYFHSSALEGEKKEFAFIGEVNLHLDIVWSTTVVNLDL